MWPHPSTHRVFMRFLHPGLLFGLSAGIQKDSRCRSRFYRAVPDDFSESKRGDAAEVPQAPYFQLSTFNC